MKHEDILASVAVVILAGVLVYLSKVGFIALHLGSNKVDRISANQEIDVSAISGAGGTPSALISGPSIYMANTPWPFGANVGNVIPPNSAGVTLPGADNADFLGFATA